MKFNETHPNSEMMYMLSCDVTVFDEGVLIYTDLIRISPSKKPKGGQWCNEVYIKVSLII